MIDCGWKGRGGGEDGWSDERVVLGIPKRQICIGAREVFWQLGAVAASPEPPEFLSYGF